MPAGKRGVLCIFTKTPLAGQVKTRLVPVLGAEGAAELYRQLLSRTLQTARASVIDCVRLYCTPTTDHPLLQDYAQGFDIELRLQAGAGLGAKMAAALAEGLAEFDYALVLGCDIPALRPADLDLACEYLASGTDVVLGPATDGGYYLLGVLAPQPGLFRNMAWGSPGVLVETRRRLSAAALHWRELPEYTDIDLPGDLPALEKLFAG